MFMMSFLPETDIGVETVSHFMMPGSAETAAGAAILAGTTKEATINIAAKTPRMLGNLVFIIPPELFKPGKSTQGCFTAPDLSLREPPRKIFDLCGRFFRATPTSSAAAALQVI
jgi:hypothetical protein